MAPRRGVTDTVLARFPGATRDGAGWAARCPAHEDRRASLSIGTGDDGRTLLHCHAGCSLDTILSAVNLVTRDLFPDTTPMTKTIVATYPYHDEVGGHLFDVVRFAPKDFRQRRADGTWKMNGVRRVVFGLPELHGQAVAYLPEGERDVLALRALGLVATTNPGGAGKWRPDYVDQLTAAGVKSVVMLPDNDDPGHQHAAAVAASCQAAGLKVKIVALPDLPPKGDISDWLGAGHTRAELVALVKATATFTGTGIPKTLPPGRTIQLTAASTITIRPVRWLWQDRAPLGTFGLVGGREGIGKSILAYTLTANITRGRLPGVYFGRPRAVIVAATEDSWEYTIVPRLMAAGADLEKVYRVDVITAESAEVSLSLPRDLAALQPIIRQVQAAMVLLDPLMSRLDSSLDTHKDAEVRLALEPLVTLADTSDAFLLGLIHVNKSASTDALTTLMGSRAFAAVARSVLFVMTDPEDDTARLLGQPKNNLGRTDLPTLTFQIAGVKVADTVEGPVWTGQLRWTGETSRSIRDAMAVASESVGDKSATSEAGDWLTDYLNDQRDRRRVADWADIKRDGAKAGHSKDALRRAKAKLGITSTTSGFPRCAMWALPLSHWTHAGETSTTAATTTTASNEPHSAQWTQRAQSTETPQKPASTGVVGADGEPFRFDPSQAYTGRRTCDS